MKTTCLKDYVPPVFVVDSIKLCLELDASTTIVTSRMKIRRTKNYPADRSLVLDGKNLELISAAVNGHVLSNNHYLLEETHLSIKNVPDLFELEIKNKISPKENTSLMGLYESNGILCTQCEAQGFRNITFFPDRPDILARYTVKLIADKKKFPVLLSNGNLINAGETDDGRHWVRWDDPYPKPSYVFAIVAGDLDYIEDCYQTVSGNPVILRIYAKTSQIDRCHETMKILKKAMLWDEQIYGLEYDLNLFNIAIMDHFNSAQENKSLNCFSPQIALFSQKTDTDLDYMTTQNVVAHEFFHNWTGNRVTCRDWFQLGLKEGLTTFRHWQFSEDIGSAPMKRIWFARLFRYEQLAEDNGPMAHAVQPESYIEISNFYTSTVYKKGAEMFRMLRTLLGDNTYYKGVKLFLNQFDGLAPTIQDFIGEMEEFSGRNLSLFSKWFTQVGHPVVKVSSMFDKKNQTYSLTFKQFLTSSIQKEKTQKKKNQAFHIPVALGFLDSKGNDIHVQLESENEPISASTRILELTKENQTFHFKGLKEEPIPSLFRNYSAPITMEIDFDDKTLAFLALNDNDSYNRWYYFQYYAVKEIQQLVYAFQNNISARIGEGFIKLTGKILSDQQMDIALLCEMMTFPEIKYICEISPVIDTESISKAIRHLHIQIAAIYRKLFFRIFEKLATDKAYSTDTQSIARRRMKNICLSFLLELDDESIRQKALMQVCKADNMTDILAALESLVHVDSKERTMALEYFYDQWKESDVLDKWFAVQARSRIPDIISRISELTEHPSFSYENPDRFKALLRTFALENPGKIHESRGEGYRLLADQLLKIDSISEKIAAWSGLLDPLSKWPRFDIKYQSLMKEQLNRIIKTPGISKGTYERTQKALQQC